jgi:hypothetical protein
VLIPQTNRMVRAHFAPRVSAEKQSPVKKVPLARTAYLLGQQVKIRYVQPRGDILLQTYSTSNSRRPFRKENLSTTK